MLSAFHPFLLPSVAYRFSYSRFWPTRFLVMAGSDALQVARPPSFFLTSHPAFCSTSVFPLLVNATTQGTEETDEKGIC